MVMNEQDLMREMAKNDIHSITIEGYRGDRYPNRAKAHVPFSDEGDNLAWLKQRVDEIIRYGRKSS